MYLILVSFWMRKHSWKIRNGNYHRVHGHSQEASTTTISTAGDLSWPSRLVVHTGTIARGRSVLAAIVRTLMPLLIFTTSIVGWIEPEPRYLFPQFISGFLDAAPYYCNFCTSVIVIVIELVKSNSSHHTYKSPQTPIQTIVDCRVVS
jgi:hypothetical protein